MTSSVCISTGMSHTKLKNNIADKLNANQKVTLSEKSYSVVSFFYTCRFKFSSQYKQTVILSSIHILFIFWTTTLSYAFLTRNWKLQILHNYFHSFINRVFFNPLKILIRYANNFDIFHLFITVIIISINLKMT